MAAVRVRQSCARFALECLQRRQRFLGSIDGHEDVIVECRGDHVAADVRPGQCSGDGGGQTDRLRIGVHGQREPGRAKQDAETCLSGIAGWLRPWCFSRDDAHDAQRVAKNATVALDRVVTACSGTRGRRAFRAVISSETS